MPTSFAELISHAQAGFAVNLLREVSMHNGTTAPQSVVLSPISVAMALSMVLLGAENETAHEMDRLLAYNVNAYGYNGFPGNIIGGYFRNQLEGLANQTEANYTLEMANRVYVKSGFHAEREFVHSVKDFYGSGFEQVDFNDTQATADQINEFVSNATHEKIQQLVRPDMFNELSRLVLVNAVYFKGLWAHPFNPNKTLMRSFHVDEEHEKELEMMVQTGEFEYSEDEYSQLLVLPYSGNDIKLFVSLPKDRFGLAQVLANFSASKTLLGNERLEKREVNVVLPKFKLESTHDLKEPLKNLGMPSAFSNDAQFGLISTEERLKIDFVVQKAMIELNEEGSEAAAATGVGGGMTLSATPPAEFVADHPFAFFLVASNGPLQNDVLFAGVFYG